MRFSTRGGRVRREVALWLWCYREDWWSPTGEPARGVVAQTTAENISGGSPSPSEVGRGKRGYPGRCSRSWHLLFRSCVRLLPLPASRRAAPLFQLLTVRRVWITTLRHRLLDCV